MRLAAIQAVLSTFEDAGEMASGALADDGGEDVKSCKNRMLRDVERIEPISIGMA